MPGCESRGYRTTQHQKRRRPPPIRQSRVMIGPENPIMPYSPHFWQARLATGAACLAGAAASAWGRLKIRAESGHKGVVGQKPSSQQRLGATIQCPHEARRQPCRRQLARCPEMAPPVAAKEAGVFNRIENGCRHPERGTVSDATQWRCPARLVTTFCTYLQPTPSCPAFFRDTNHLIVQAMQPPGRVASRCPVNHSAENQAPE
jgi:hypothetical protein